MKTKIGRPTGPEGPRNSLLSVRVTPKVRFGLEMLSRLHNTPIPDLVIRAIRELFNSEHEGLWDYDYEPVEGEPNGPRYLLDILWAEKPSDRLANIGLNCKNLLTLDEKRLWLNITSQPKYWRHESQRTEAELRRDVLAEDWDTLEA